MKGLTLQNISLQFSSTAKPFFAGLTGHFDAGKLSFIQGKNGIGKSTLFRLIQGNLRSSEVTRGTLTINGAPYDVAQHRRHDDVKMVQQKFDLMLADQFSFEQNLTFATFGTLPGLAPLGTPLCVDFPLDQFGINLHAPVSRLSGGQRQILAILMVLQKPTSVLLLDEPTSALDEKNSRMVLDFLHLVTVQQNLVTLIITHDAGLMREYASDGHYELQQTESGRTLERQKA